MDRVRKGSNRSTFAHLVTYDCESTGTSKSSGKGNKAELHLDRVRLTVDPKWDVQAACPQLEQLTSRKTKRNFLARRGLWCDVRKISVESTST